MAKTLTIRNVPVLLRQKIKRRAAKHGMTMRAYLLQNFERLVETPTLEEMMARLKRIPPYKGKVSPTKVLRAQRDGRL